MVSRAAERKAAVEAKHFNSIFEFKKPKKTREKLHQKHGGHQTLMASHPLPQLVHPSDKKNNKTMSTKFTIHPSTSMQRKTGFQS